MTYGDYRDNDYTKHRSSTAAPATNDTTLKIGREDSIDKVNVTTMTVSGTASLIPASPLGRRNYIKIENLDVALSVYILPSATATCSGGYLIAAGDEWEDDTDAIFYMATLSGSADVQIYERSSRFNYV